jgi:hypothetical protein
VNSSRSESHDIFLYFTYLVCMNPFLRMFTRNEDASILEGSVHVVVVATLLG